jgi:Zn finger protein HypA/HybF involved in hydrogenase expression
LAKKPGRYTCCHASFARGAEIVFRYEPRAIRCVSCAERDPESRNFRPSLQWERVRGRRREA